MDFGAKKAEIAGLPSLALSQVIQTGNNVRSAEDVARCFRVRW